MLTRKESIERLLWWLIAGTKGGQTRATIISALHDMPGNPNQLADKLTLDYKTIRHHLEVLGKNGMISIIGQGYGATYVLSSELMESYDKFEEIWSKIGESKKKKRGMAVRKQ